VSSPLSEGAGIITRPPSTVDKDVEPPAGVTQVLFADDVGVNRQLFDMNVRRFFGKGWSVKTVATAQEAVEMARTIQLDVIIMDEIFAGHAMQGSEAIRLIREHYGRQGGDHAPVIIWCTGHADEELKAGAVMEAGADACWGKPMPSAADGSMQRELGVLLARKRSQRPTPMRASWHLPESPSPTSSTTPPPTGMDVTRIS